jgi:glycosyltransferase involved in cell wall biosynthesis
MKIGILGSRGIPNRYGGFEQLAEQLATGLSALGNEVVVYSPHHHPYQETNWQGAEIVHCRDPRWLLGPASQFVYDLWCILDSRKRSFDIILQLGYTTSAMWFWLHPREVPVVTHMDGLEWSRSKYRGLVRIYLRWAERKAARDSAGLIADSVAIQKYLQESLEKEAEFIAYGAVNNAPCDQTVPASLNLVPGAYFHSVARFQPDNHQEMIIRAWAKAGCPFPLVLTGNADNRYGLKLQKRYLHPDLNFTGAMYDQEKLRGLRASCRLYIHGHSGGGTNPSLLEAMADGALIAAYDSVFNREVLRNSAFFFRNEDELAEIMLTAPQEYITSTWCMENWQHLSGHYSWPAVIRSYQSFLKTLSDNKLRK